MCNRVFSKKVSSHVTFVMLLFLHRQMQIYDSLPGTCRHGCAGFIGKRLQT